MITYAIIAITCLVSISAFNNPVLFQKTLFSPYLIKNNREWYRFFSHALVHADWGHLLMNMFVLYSFGHVVEIMYFPFLFEGFKADYYFILLYVGGIITSALPSFEKHKLNSYYTSVGASGAVSSVVFAGILINPMDSIYFIFLPFPIPGFIFGLLYLLYSWYMAKKANDNIGHDAHFWGAVFGFVITGVFKPQLFLFFADQIINSF